MKTGYKLFPLLTTLSALFVLSGCNQYGVRAEQELVSNSSVNQEDPRATLVLASRDLVGDIRLSSPRFQSVGDLTRAQVTVQNLSENRYTLEYRFEWADYQGFATGGLSSWHRYTLSPREARKFTSTGKVPEATSITFTTRLPDDVFIRNSDEQKDSNNYQSTDY